MVTGIVSFAVKEWDQNTLLQLPVLISYSAVMIYVSKKPTIIAITFFIVIIIQTKNI